MQALKWVGLVGLIVVAVWILVATVMASTARKAGCRQSEPRSKPLICDLGQSKRSQSSRCQW